MNLEELEKLFLELLKKCSKLDLKEQISLLLKEASRAEGEELRIVIYLYINYLIEQVNVKGRTPFVMPSINDIKEISTKLKDRNAELDDLVKAPVQELRLGPVKSQYLETTTPTLTSSSSLYNSISPGSEFYKESYIPGAAEEKYLESLGSKRERFDSPLTENIESAKRFKSVDTGYTPLDEKRKKEEKKILYG